VRINSPIDLNVFDPSKFAGRTKCAWENSGGGGVSRDGALPGPLSPPPPPPPRFKRLVVGRLSRLAPEKNPAAFIYVARAVTDALREACSDSAAAATAAAATNTPFYSSSLCVVPRFVLAGDGPLRASLEELASQWVRKHGTD
jgi:glycosyltransferase involved in cell wall biosynthesis